MAYTRTVDDVSDNLSSYRLELIEGLEGLRGGAGTLTNGKIAVTVASNNLTVTLKTMIGTDPTATNPVGVRIGNDIRFVTSALSVTKAAATNWFNSGSTELATQEIDYFVYLGYNATDGVVLGFSRIPYARLYSDFSATTTNEKYAAISTITNAAAGDSYVNIGRFAATLSAGAGYTWSVPTYTNDNLVQHPIDNTRLLTFTVSTAAGNLTAGAGSPTTVTDTASYRIRGKQVFVRHNVIVTDKGTASGYLRVAEPFTFNLNDNITGSEYQSVGYAIYGTHATATAINMWKYDAVTLWQTGHRFIASGWLELP